MNARELEAYKRLLLQRRELLSNDMNQMENEALKVTKSDLATWDITSFADRGTDSYEQEFTLDIIENEADQLREIDHALTKLEGGAFGECEQCEKSIAKARLKVMPHARLCIGCKREEEEAAGGA